MFSWRTYAAYSGDQKGLIVSDAVSQAALSGLSPQAGCGTTEYGLSPGWASEIMPARSASNSMRGGGL